MDIDFLEEPKAGKWTKAVMRVSNQGTGPAKSVSVQLKGPIEISQSALHQVRGLRNELEARMADMVPDIGVDIDFLEEPKAGKWTKAVMRVSNQGSGPAKSVSVQLKGPIEIRGGRFLPLVAPGKTERFGVELCPRNSGKLAVTLVLEAKSQLTDEDCGYEGEFEMKAV